VEKALYRLVTMETSAKHALIASIVVGALIVVHGASSTLYAFTAACFAALQVAIFLYYDSFQMQPKSSSSVSVPVSNTKSAEQQIVEELFPETVRERLYQRNQANQDSTRVVTQLTSSPPIMDVYPEATVLFADLAGFTAWSSGRDPARAFQLLESLYGAFDALAAKHKVFKVETVGDAYLAIAGAPVADPRHAQHMADFAIDIMAAAERILSSGTTALQLRIGMHSGPVAAGVLRGAKSRFQIFGDTVNTAARMETLSRPGRIQVSQAVYNCLAPSLADDRAAHSLHRRSDTVFAKGKGPLTTYWLKMIHNNNNNDYKETYNTRRPPSVPSSNTNTRMPSLEELLLADDKLLLQSSWAAAPIMHSRCNRMLPQRSRSTDDCFAV
jgi:class 3 adenylate cyclase